jgi:glycosyltransferase involved in cell wall biosynthesis
LLNPIRWDEPFGLVMIEALATGTPVLAFAEGSAPEIVDDGLTGFVCDDEDMMAVALAKARDLSRDACRAAAEQRFSAAGMVAEHRRLYAELLDDGTTAPVIPLRHVV